MFELLHLIGRRIAAYFRVSQVWLAEHCGILLIYPSHGHRIDKTKKHPIHFAGKAVSLCRGTGIEVGALHRRLPLVANVLYLDVRSTDGLLEQYQKDDRVTEINQIHLVANGGRYPFIDTGAFDFVASSHVLEHTANPARQIQEWLRIVRKGGVVYMIVPDMRYCFDRRRGLTPLPHLIDEFDSDISTISIEHYRDYIINTNDEDGIKRDISEGYVTKCHAEQGSIHVHTFTAESVKEFLIHFAVPLSFELIHFEARQLNIHCALRKTAPKKTVMAAPTSSV